MVLWVLTTPALLLEPIPTHSLMSSSSSSSCSSRHSGRKSGKMSSNKSAKFKLIGSGSTVPRLWSAKESQVYQVIQTIPEAIIQQGSSATLGALYFQLNQVAQYSTFTGLFDQYMISKVRVVFRPMFMATALTGSSTFYEPQLWVVCDNDDSGAPSNLAVLQSYGNCQTSMYETQIIEFTPHVAIAASGGGAFTSYANMNSVWVDAASPTVGHYGLKYGVDPGGSGQVNFQSWTVNVQMQLRFRNVR